MKTVSLVVLVFSAVAFAADKKTAPAPVPTADKFALGDAKKGETTFKNMCLTCHGEKGDGNGPAGAALNPKPANFNDPVRMTPESNETIFKIIKEGGAAHGKSPLMVAWGGALSDEQIKDVAAYVRAFNKGSPAATPSAAPKKK